MKFYKRDPDAAIAGMSELTLEERGAYNTIIDHAYSRDGIIPDDDRLLARMLGVHVNRWRPIKTRLIALGKIWIEGNGCMGVTRVNATLEEATLFSKTQANRAHTRWEKHRRINGTAHAKAAMPLTPTPIASKKERKKESTATDVAETQKRTPEKANRGTRLPENWSPTEACWLVCETMLGIARAHEALVEFRDYWTALPDGRQARKINWDKTFTNRCRALKGRNGHGQSRTPTPRERTVEALQRLGGGSAGEVFDLGLPKLRHQ